MGVQPRLASDLLRGDDAEPEEFAAVVAAVLRRTVPHDGWVLVGLDPATRLRTFQFCRNGTDGTAELARLEAAVPDVNKYADLARAAVPAGWLGAGHPLAGTSVRLNEILIPQGVGSELRLVLRDRDAVWGAIVLYRDAGTSFGERDVARLLTIAPELTEAFRRHPVRTLRGAPGPAPTGVVLLAPDDRLVAVSPEAQAWLDDLVPGHGDETGPNDVTRVLYDAAQVVRAGGPDSVRAAVRTISGRWLEVSGHALPGGEADVAVVLQPAGVPLLLDAVAAGHRLTPREHRVLVLAARGLTSRSIARELDISPWTVNDHLSSIYRKCGVRGRDELLGGLVASS
ncbi:LuxR C-terminal-related transcriptional regulator [Nocardioides sp.]|uniref:helix-turn-helix transcriptional regulator n=1 Tax=Nocardioides sp. TaxID=35761 RepID=UPI0035B3C019